MKILKVALTKELGDQAKLVYIIKMENTYGNKQPFTEKIPSINQNCYQVTTSRHTFKEQKS